MSDQAVLLLRKQLKGERPHGLRRPLRTSRDHSRSDPPVRTAGKPAGTHPGDALHSPSTPRLSSSSGPSLDSDVPTHPAPAAAELSRNPIEGFSAGLIDDSNVFEWEIMIMGPPDNM